jgi:hypothetical protein
VPVSRRRDSDHDLGRELDVSLGLVWLDGRWG